jgi:hypothetical protein
MTMQAMFQISTPNKSAWTAVLLLLGMVAKKDLYKEDFKKKGGGERNFGGSL